MQEIYREDPSYWPHGLRVVGHDDLYLIREKAASNPVGFVGFQKIPESNGDLIGYYTIGILPQFRKQGFAKEAIETMLKEKHAEVKEVRAMVMSHNTPSRELADALNIPMKIKAATTELAKDLANRAIESEKQDLRDKEEKDKELVNTALDDRERELKLQEQQIKIQEHSYKEQDRLDKIQDKEEKKQEKQLKQVADARKAMEEQQKQQAEEEARMQEEEAQRAEEEEQQILMEKEDMNSRLPASLQPNGNGAGGGGIKITGGGDFYSGPGINNMQISKEEPTMSSQTSTPKTANCGAFVDSVLQKQAGPTKAEVAQSVIGAIFGGSAGYGESEATAKTWDQLTGGESEALPFTQWLNTALGALAGGAAPRVGKDKVDSAKFLTQAWVPKSLAIGGTDVGLRYAGGQAALSEKALEAARQKVEAAKQEVEAGKQQLEAARIGTEAAKSQGEAAESIAGAGKDVSNALKALVGLGGAAGLTYGGYKLYEHINKMLKKKNRKPKGDVTVKGKPSRKRHKVKIDVPAEALPPEFFSSLIDVDDAEHARMKAPAALLPGPKKASWYLDNDIMEKSAILEGAGNFMGTMARQAVPAWDAMFVNPIVKPTLEAAQQNPLYKMFFPNYPTLISKSWQENIKSDVDPLQYQKQFDDMYRNRQVAKWLHKDTQTFAPSETYSKSEELYT
jgi:hypothetical protein